MHRLAVFRHKRASVNLLKNPFSLKFRRLLYILHQGTEEPHFHVCVLCKDKGKDTIDYGQGEIRNNAIRG
jgi:hypothetical protein